MKHLIFDCGGVLVYPAAGTWAIPVRMREVLGPRFSDIGGEKYARAHREAAPWLDESRLILTLDEEYRRRREYLRVLDAGMGWRLTEAELDLLADDFTHNIRRYGFYEDIDAWLPRWKRDHALGILSDAMPSLPVFLRQYGILDLFDAAVFSTQIGAIKPDPRMYSAILEALGADPGDCLFVDDRPCNLDGAIRAGLRAVQMIRPGTAPEALWDGPRVNDFEALDRLLEHERD